MLMARALVCLGSVMLASMPGAQLAERVYSKAIIKLLAPMPVHLTEQQPPEIWAAVGQMIAEHWGWSHRASRSLGIEQKSMTLGWLDPKDISTLLAVDIPVYRLFSAAALAAREPDRGS